MKIRLLEQNEAPPMNLLLMADPSQRSIDDYLKRGYTYIVEEASQVVGVYVLLPTRPGTIELVNLALSDTYQGKGIGKKLVRDALKRAKSKGFKTIEVGTGNSSLNQLALYQKCGFKIAWIDKDYFIRNYEEDIMENGIQCVDMIRLSQDL